MDCIQQWGRARNMLNQISTEWHKPCPPDAHNAIRLDVGAKGVIEWVPQHTIFFNNTNMGLEHHIVLGKKLCYIGCKILCFGHAVSGESFTGGYIGRDPHVCHTGQPIWFEQIRLEEGGKAMTGAIGLGGRGVCAMLVAAREGLPASMMEAARKSIGSIVADHSHFGVFQFNSFLVVHYVGNSSETARRIMTDCWSSLWPKMLVRETTVARN